ncbi:MAG: hypothetical protein ABSF77_02075 [Spirochaetia bacterium]|jgi:hypothetical protein
MKKLSVLFMLFAIVVSGIGAQKTQEGFYLDQSVQASYDPLGFQLVSQAYYRMPLVNREGVLWESTKIDVGLLNNLSPAYDMAGAYITITPIALLDITLSAQVAGFYDLLGFGFYSLGGYNAGFDNDSLALLSPKNTFGYVLSASPTFKIAIGPFVLVNDFNLTYYYVDDGNGFFFERVANCALGKNDVELLNQAYALWTILPGLLAGVNDYLLYVPGSGYVSHRLAAIGVYSTTLKRGLSFNAALILGTFLADQYFQYTLYVAAQAGISVAL